MEKKFDLRHIMLKAWELYRKHTDLSFAECLHRAWLSAKAKSINEKRIESAKAAAGVAERTATWSEWRKLGYEVVSGAKSLFSCELIWGSRGDGMSYKASFFSESQVTPMAI